MAIRKMRVLPEFRRVLLAELRPELDPCIGGSTEPTRAPSADSRRKRSLPTAVAIPDIVPVAATAVIAAIGNEAVFAKEQGTLRLRRKKKPLPGHRGEVCCSRSVF
jgi:hypothetical protein